MKLLPWLATLSSPDRTSAAADSTVPFPPPSSSSSSSSSDRSNSSETASTSTPESRGTRSTIESSLSLRTLPSVPSLEIMHGLPLSPESLHLSAVSHRSLTSIRPRGTQPITCLTSHGHLLYVASAHIVDVYDAATLAHLDSFNASAPSSGSVKSIGFCHGRIFTGHQDSKIRVWRVAGGESKQYRQVAALPTFSDRLRRFVLPKNYVTVRRHRKHLWIDHADAVTGLAVNDGLVYSISWDRTLKVWRESDLRCLESVRTHDDAVNAVAVSGDGTVYTGSADRRIRVWAKRSDERQHGLIATLEKHKSTVNALALSSDGSILFSGSCDRSILVWEECSVNHMTVTGALRGHGKAILCLIYISNLLLSGSEDQTIRIWRQCPDGRFSCLATLEGHRKPVKTLAAFQAGDGGLDIFSGSLDGEIKDHIEFTRPK
ncbi:hypothetical protein SAY86_031723 [Trapa natans]|uniref:Uncharacterized protein n=1 Tax=Trapa natans TaxID=22666 RepID=A0AAN7LSC3_TRANT|nr:hypothetical protein SAY86_031723 [Trapa natans]